jgi:hypothetical protein
MAALAHSSRYPGYSHLGCRKPKVEERNTPPILFAALQKAQIGLPRTSSFKRKTPFFDHKNSHSLNHSAPRSECSRVHVVRRDASRNLVSIEVRVQFERFSQQNPRCRRLSGSIRTANYDDLFQVHFSRPILRVPYAGCSSLLPPFFSDPAMGTGPCVSAVGGGGASPIRFE